MKRLSMAASQAIGLFFKKESTSIEEMLSVGLPANDRVLFS